MYNKVNEVEKSSVKDLLYDGLKIGMRMRKIDVLLAHERLIEIMKLFTNTN